MIGKKPESNNLFFNWDMLGPDFFKGAKLYCLLRETLPLFVKEDDYKFLYCLDNGRPSISPCIIIGVMLLQKLTNTSDRQAVELLKNDLRWKYALDLPINDTSFDRTNLVKCRAKLMIHNIEGKIFEDINKLAIKLGILKPGAVQLADASHIYGDCAVMSTYEIIRTAILSALRRIPVSIELEHLHKYKDGKAEIDWKDPNQRAEHLKELISDARALISAVKDTEYETDERILLLKDILNQRIDENGKKIKGAIKDKILSTIDPEMRYGSKPKTGAFPGFKVQIAEDSDSELITNVDIIPANVNDDYRSVELMTEQEHTFGCCPETVIADTAYGISENRKKMEACGINLVSPVLSNEKKDGGLYPKSKFIIDLDNETVTCPCGNSTTKYINTVDNKGQPIIQFIFSEEACNSCPDRNICTKSKGPRHIKINYNEEDLQKAYAFQQTEEFKETYSLRLKIEAKIWEVMNLHGLRWARFKGKAKIRLDAFFTAAAVNLKRIIKLTTEASNITNPTPEIA